MRLVKSPMGEIAEQCVWTLSNIAGDSPVLRDYVIECGFLSPLLELINSSSTVRER